MINANLEQFLDTGMMHDCSLYYNGFLYYLNGYCDYKDNVMFYHYEIYKMPSEIVDEIYQRRLSNVCEVLLSIDCPDEATLKKIFFESPIFDGKTFWEVEKELAWYDEV